MEPKIRLKGFSGEWETHSLSEYFKKVTEKNTKMEYSVVLTNSAEYGVIPQSDFFDHAIANDKNIGGYYVVSPDDFVYNPRVSVTAPVGPINRSSLCYIGVMSPLYLVFKINGINKDYLNIFYKTNKWHKFMKLEGNCGARFDRLSISDEQFVKMPLVHPSDFNEQQEIADYFKSLDSLIQSTTKKIESLKKVKAASLLTLFPQEGEKAPRVRFKGFKSEWVKVPLSTFAKKSTEKNGAMNYTITLTNSAEHGVVNQRDFFDHDISNDENIHGYYVIHNDDFVYNPRISSTAPVGPISRNQLGYSGVMSPLYLIFKVEGIDKNFLSYFFKTMLWHNYMKYEGNTGARFDRLAISDTQFFNMPIIMPIQENEQKAIANYFTSLDSQINLQTQRLEKLKQIKSACLDNMFV